MSWHFVIKLLDASDNVLVTKDVIDPRATWKAPLKSELVRIEEENIEINWKKISVIIEKV